MKKNDDQMEVLQLSSLYLYPSSFMPAFPSLPLHEITGSFFPQFIFFIAGSYCMLLACVCTKDPVDIH